MSDSEIICVLKDEVNSLNDENINLIATIEKLNARVKTSSDNYILLQNKLAGIKTCSCPFKPK